MQSTYEEKINQVRKILAPNRLKLLQMLSSKDTCVCEMVKKTGLKHNLISHHLKVLTDIGFIKSRKNGQHNIYTFVESKRKITKQVISIIINI